MSEILARITLARPGFVLDVDLRLPGRGVTVLFGPSGCGKTTLLRCLAGLEPRARGRLVFAGEVWQDGKRFLPTHRRALGYVFQEANLFPHLSVRRNLEYGRRRRGGTRALAPLIELLGIGHLLERNPEGLSGGERQRVAIARALAASPRLLLMDEPLAALDVARRKEILPYLERLHDELDIPMIYVTHAPEELARLADHVVLLEAGQVRASGALTELAARSDLLLSFGEEAGAVVEGRVEAVEHAWHLARVGFAGGALWVRDDGLAPGRRVRLRVLARDVSLALAPGVSSIQNVLSGRIETMAEDSHPALLVARVRVGETSLLARLTRRAAAELGLAAGREVWVQVKSAALL